MESKLMNRVPPIIFTYWIIKIAATTLGETGADALSHTMKLGYITSSLIFLAMLLIFLLIKLKTQKYTPTLYWLTFAATSLAGTSICDYMDRTLGLGYMLGSVILMALLLLTLCFWKYTEKSLSVEKVYTNKSEILYWVAFLISNTLGTAIGDYLADDLGFGFAKGALVIALSLGILIVLHYYTKLSSILLFWVAFVLTRPFGATFGDFLTKPRENGGLDLGTYGSSTFFMVVLAILIYNEHRKLTLRKVT